MRIIGKTHVDASRCHEQPLALTSKSIKIGFGATLVVTLAFCISYVPPAQAQFLFWPHFPYRTWGAHGPHRHHYQYRHQTPESATIIQPVQQLKGPLQLIVSIADQRISLYDNGRLIERSPVSTGVVRHPTPLGVFSVISKQRWHRSNIYSAAPMPYMQRITWSGIALHAGKLPGRPASHGCIRLTNDFAIRLWHLTKRGTRVIIAREDIQPVSISSPHLFQPTPKAETGSPDPRAVTVANSGISDTKTQDAAKFPDPTSGVVAPQEAVPISIFVSRKLSRLFVRKRFTPLFDAPVEVQNPEQPLGTHVFTAMAFQNQGASLPWTVVSMPEELPPPSGIKDRRAPAKKASMEVAAPSPDKANAALNRIDIPQDTVERISELLTPGSSLVISDNGLGDETGKDTDFIVITH